MSANQPPRVLGLFISSFLSERLGRRMSLILGSVLHVVTGVAVYFCHSFVSLTIAISVSAVSLQMVTVPSYALLSEICLIRYRNVLACLNYFTDNFGWLLGLLMGLVIPIQYYYLSLCLPSLIFLLLCWKLPESPVWLMRSGYEEEARQALTWIRGDHYNVEPELKVRYYGPYNAMVEFIFYRSWSLLSWKRQKIKASQIPNLLTESF